MMLSEGQLETFFPYFAAAWIVVSLAASGFLHFSKKAALKFKVFVTLVVVSNVAILGWMKVVGAPWFFMAFAIAIVAYNSWQGICHARFCNQCGASNFAKPSRARLECKRCGAQLVHES